MFGHFEPTRTVPKCLSADLSRVRSVRLLCNKTYFYYLFIIDSQKIVDKDIYSIEVLFISNRKSAEKCLF